MIDFQNPQIRIQQPTICASLNLILFPTKLTKLHISEKKIKYQMFKKIFSKYLLIALIVILCFHFLLTYFNPNVKNPWSIITEDHYIDSDKDVPIINNEKETNNEIGTGARTITKSITQTKILTTTVKNIIQPTQTQEEEIKQTKTIEKEKPTKQKTIPPRKAKAAFVILIRNGDLKSFRYSMIQLEQRFNRKYKYPYVFLNDVPFTEEFMRQVRNLTRAKCEFGMYKNK